ncbi:MAG: Flp family type IVb pilin [Gemmataceae bacterium]|nr:Flp family type IVb pilin [Gemmataceae bacterium]
MRNLARACVNFLKKEDGPTAVEYAIMLALVVTVCIGVLSTVGTQAGR